MTELSTHTQAELAHRSSGGMDVTLFWAPARGEDREDKVVVCVRDRRDGAYFEILAEPSRARRLLPPVRLPGPEHGRLARQSPGSLVRWSRSVPTRTRSDAVFAQAALAVERDSAPWSQPTTPAVPTRST